MLSPAYPIRTARLTLRPFALADLDDVHAYQRQPAVARWMAWEPRDRDQSLASVRAMAGEDGWRAEGDCLTVAVVVADTGTVVGQVELVWRSLPNRQGEIGYVLNPDHGGRGLATEATAAVLRWGFEEGGLRRIVGRCAAGNTASVRLLERLDMRREAHFVEHDLFKGEWVDRYVYAMLDREWRSRTRSVVTNVGVHGGAA
ncbi:GNAT family N-acetyltransferase [Plantactinospora sp. GCM10030261]|uniref:GNAT family N-acetyltransferase n=1 Tax=Plantactinospora sp. GCM10030261 TaxID=3273420 RepID=UPI00360A1F0F